MYPSARWKHLEWGRPFQENKTPNQNPTLKQIGQIFYCIQSGLDVSLPVEPVGWTLRLPTGMRDATWQMSLSRNLVPFCVHLLKWKCHRVLVKLLIKLWGRPMSARVVSMPSWQLMLCNLASKLRVSRSRLESLCEKVCNQAASEHGDPRPSQVPNLLGPLKCNQKGKLVALEEECQTGKRNKNRHLLM